MATDAALNSIEDWDKSSTDIQFDSKPESRPTTPKGGENTKRRFAELLQKHAEDGKAVDLSAEDEVKLSEELAAWINSDSGPFEPADDWFARKAAELKAQKEADANQA
ncbi:hypothetical protein BKA62DRAFT_672074 [Auriculariales sp. MPI-PUGE-AT-0066]|nr:hypothetical protein BKA62DRAFT_672074 [Auriculariales sp. MPI-PUGE-AT-0066]